MNVGICIFFSYYKFNIIFLTRFDWHFVSQNSSIWKKKKSLSYLNLIHWKLLFTLRILWLLLGGSSPAHSSLGSTHQSRSTRTTLSAALVWSHHCSPMEIKYMHYVLKKNYKLNKNLPPSATDGVNRNTLTYKNLGRQKTERCWVLKNLLVKAHLGFVCLFVCVTKLSRKTLGNFLN